MFLLSEGTLFFLDLALNARTCDEKPSLSTVVQKWVDEVAAATKSDDPARDGRTTTGGSSTLYASSPINLSTAIGRTSPTNGGGIADDEDFDENKKSYFHEASTPTPNDRCYTDPEASPSRQKQSSRKSVKRKVDDMDTTPDASNWNEDDIANFEEPISLTDDTRQVATMTSTSVGRPPQKKVRCEDASAASLSASSESTRGCAAFIAQLQSLRAPQVNNKGYTTKRSAYTTKDLPVPCDKRWSQSFLSTAILWYSAQKNIWNVSNTDLTSALQRIFNVVYPDTRYRVTTAGPVFVLTLQRIHEWRSSFGSSALAMILHFFSSLDHKDDVHTAAEFLATDFRFLRADPDSSEPSEPFRSPFLLTLLAITHLGDIAAFVDVPGWDTQAMAAGEGSESVIAIASAALERALTLFRDGTVDVDHVLAETARRPDASLPGTVLDTLVPPALRFSSVHWSNHTAAYRAAVGKRGVAFVRATFTAAQAKRRKFAGEKNGESELCAGMSTSEAPDPRALL